MQNGQKLQRAVRIAGVAVVVYIVFRYFLPLVAPFLLACGAALLLKPSACWLSGKLRITWRGRSLGIGSGVVGIAELLVLMTGIGFIIYAGGRKLYQQALLLTNQFPYWMRQLDVYLTGACHRMEEFFSLKDETMVVLMREMLLNLIDTVKQGVMPYLMGNSFLIAKCCVGFGILVALFTIGVMLFIQELDDWKKKIKKSMFSQELQRIGRLLGIVGNAYLRTQGLIMFLTMIICTIGFWLLGNPYSILAGIAIGILDALPVFGTGTVLIPWAVVLCIQGKWLRGFMILGLYLVCYFVRELVETKMMGDKVGLSPLETLISIYVGLQLFGVMGVFLGPVGLLMVKEFS